MSWRVRGGIVVAAVVLAAGAAGGSSSRSIALSTADDATAGYMADVTVSVREQSKLGMSMLELSAAFVSPVRCPDPDHGCDLRAAQLRAAGAFEGRLVWNGYNWTAFQATFAITGVDFSRTAVTKDVWWGSFTVQGRIMSLEAPNGAPTGCTVGGKVFVFADFLQGERREVEFACTANFRWPLPFTEGTFEITGPALTLTRAEAGETTAFGATLLIVARQNFGEGNATLALSARLSSPAKCSSATGKCRLTLKPSGATYGLHAHDWDGYEIRFRVTEVTFVRAPAGTELGNRESELITVTGIVTRVARPEQDSQAPYCLVDNGVSIEALSLRRPVDRPYFDQLDFDVHFKPGWLYERERSCDRHAFAPGAHTSFTAKLVGPAVT